MISPKTSFVSYNGLDPLRDGAKSPRAMRVDVLMGDNGNVAIEDIDLNPFVRDHQMPFIQGAFIDGSLMTTGYLILLVAQTGHRVRFPTPGQMWAPLIVADDLRFTLVGPQTFVGKTVRLFLTNFEVGASYNQVGAAP